MIARTLAWGLVLALLGTAAGTAHAAPPVLLLQPGGNKPLASSVIRTLAPTVGASRATLKKLTRDRSLKKLTGDKALYAKLDRLRQRPGQTVISVAVFRRGDAWWLDAAVLDGVELRHILLPASGPAGTDWHAQLRSFALPRSLVAPPDTGALPGVPMDTGEKKPPATPTPAPDPWNEGQPPAEPPRDPQGQRNEDAEEEEAESDEKAPPVAGTAEAATAPENGDAAPRPAPRASPAAARARFFDVMVGPAIAGRWLAYKGLSTQNLSSYQAVGAPTILAGVLFAPLARSPLPILRDSYAYGTLSETVGVRSRDAYTNTVYDTRWSAWEAGIAIRSRTTDSGKGPVLGGTVGYGNETFAVEESRQLVTQQPSVSYSYLNLGFVLDQPLARWVRLELNASYRFILDPGYLGGRFPSTHVFAPSAYLAVRFLLPRGFTVRALLQYTCYFYKISSAATDPYQATGAIDQFASAGLQATWGI